uniref:transposase n=1 Tax=Marinithermofilum abyssi TaxID=1571185 RepID=UPI0035709BD2
MKPYRGLRTTNRLEGLNQEIRRREWVIPILPNHSGIIRKRQKQEKPFSFSPNRRLLQKGRTCTYFWIDPID